jgi:acetolactate synthase-1/2/3 large subunit
MKASDLFVRCLEAEGVTHIFGVPGEENADVMISLMDSSIRFVLCRHEQAAAFAADAYGRLTGKAGVCLGTLGPGATNLVTGVADANMDRSPLVCIIGQGSTRRLHKESHQNMDSVAMFAPITKWAHTIWDAGTVPEVVRKAFKTAEAEKPGATLIELPEDIAKEESDEAPMAAVKTRRPGADHKVVRQAVELIAGAKRPIVLAGNGAVRKRAARQLRRFAHKTGIGVVNTFMGKGAVPMSDPHCLFTMGLQSRDYINLALDDADLVISVGYDLVEYAPSFWNHDRSTRIIHIDFDPAEIDSHYPVVLDIQADIADALWQINEALNRRFDSEGRLPLFDIGERRKLRDAIHDDLAMEKDDASFPMKPQKILYDVRRHLGPDDILLSDVGAHKMWIARYYQCDEPNTCLISNGFCTMGFAFPGSLGAKIAMPDRRVLSINGDAGFFMNAQDMETAVRRRLNVVAMIWMDGAYGLIEWKQRNAFDGRHFDLSFTNPDLRLWAESYGAWGRTIEKADELVPALEEAFEQPGPAVIGVPIDYGENMKLSARLGKIEYPI